MDGVLKKHSLHKRVPCTLRQKEMTLEYLLQRYSDNRESTLGLLFVKRETLFFFCYTLEDQFQEVKVRAETRIPAGKYEIVIQREETPKTLSYRKRYPNWFKSHLMLKDVPGFTGIYIHIGNTDSDTEGCILLGDNADNNRIGPGALSNSTQAFIRFYNFLYDHLDWKENGKYVNKAFIEIFDENKLL